MRNTRLIGRIAVVLGACLSLPALVCGPAAAASGPTPPTLTRTEATWKIPKGHADTEWTMKLWTCPPAATRCSGKLLGMVTKKTGVLKLSVPPVPGCTYQANIIRGKHLYVVHMVTFSPCSSSGQTTTTTSGDSTSTTGRSTTGTSGGGTSGSEPSATTSTGGSGPTTTTGPLAFTGTGFMLDVLGVLGALLAVGGLTILWYVRPRKRRPVV
jgi:hypothetical protein